MTGEEKTRLLVLEAELQGLIEAMRPKLDEWRMLKRKRDAEKEERPT